MKKPVSSVKATADAAAKKAEEFLFDIWSGNPPPPKSNSSAAVKKTEHALAAGESPPSENAAGAAADRTASPNPEAPRREPSHASPNPETHTEAQTSDRVAKPERDGPHATDIRVEGEEKGRGHRGPKAEGAADSTPRDEASAESTAPAGVTTAPDAKPDIAPESSEAPEDQNETKGEMRQAGPQTTEHGEGADGAKSPSALDDKATARVKAGGSDPKTGAAEQSHKGKSSKSGGVDEKENTDLLDLGALADALISALQLNKRELENHEHRRPERKPTKRKPDDTVVRQEGWRRRKDKSGASRRLDFSAKSETGRVITAIAERLKITNTAAIEWVLSAAFCHVTGHRTPRGSREGGDSRG